MQLAAFVGPSPKTPHRCKSLRKIKPDIGVISAPQCVSRSKDVEKCKKTKSEIFALTALLHPTDDIMTHQVVTHSEYGNK